MALDKLFEIGAPIHIGQVTTAYPALIRETGAKVLLKVLHPQYSQDDEIAGRFRREAEAMAGIDHPNVVKVLDFGADEDMAYMVLEWIDNGTLDDRIAMGPMKQTEIERIAESIFSGLSAVHKIGMIHRDLKPDNILLDKSGRVVVADFSLAGFAGRTDMTSHGAMVGSPAYMAPELLDGRQADARTDLFSVGVILLEALTGSNPFRSDDPMVSLTRLQALKIPRLQDKSSINPQLAFLIDSLLARNPKDRPQSTADAIAILHGDAPEATPTAESQTEKASSRKTIFTVLAALLIIAVIAIGGISWLKPEKSDSTVEEATFIPSADSLVAQIEPTPKNEPELTQDTAQVKNNDELAIIDKPRVENRRKNVDTADIAVPAKNGFLSMIVRPWARVYINGVYRGVTPVGTLSLSPGEQTLELTSDVYPTIRKKIVISPAETLSLSIDLSKESGLVSVSAEPWGYLWMDGDSVGILPRSEQLWFSPGLHFMKVTHPTLGDWQDSVMVEKGRKNAYVVNIKDGTVVAQ